jgi:hypothetical protein
MLTKGNWPDIHAFLMSVYIYNTPLQISTELPPLMLQLFNPINSRLEPFLKPFPPPLSPQPLSLQTRPLMKALLIRIASDLIPPTTHLHHPERPSHINILGNRCMSPHTGVQPQWNLVQSCRWGNIRVDTLHELLACVVKNCPGSRARSIFHARYIN